MIKVTLELKAKVGDTVCVENYRSKHKPWETGVVSYVNISIDKELESHIHYEVILHRTSMRRKGRELRPFAIRLTVGNNKLELFTNYSIA